MSAQNAKRRSLTAHLLTGGIVLLLTISIVIILAAVSDKLDPMQGLASAAICVFVAALVLCFVALSEKLVFPVLTWRGFLVVGTITLAPLLGLIGELELSLSLGIALTILVLVLLQLVIDYGRAAAFVVGSTVTTKMPSRVYSGLETSVTFHGEIPAHKRPRTLHLRVERPPRLSVTTEIHPLDIPAGGSHFEIEHRFTPLGRGEMQWTAVWGRLVAPNRLSVWQFRKVLEGETTGTVYPNPYCHAGTGQRALHALSIGTTPFDHAGGEGKEFDRLRRYTVGDDLRRVDWKRSAKAGSLLIKTYRPETHQRVNIALDCSRRMGNIVDDRLQLDHAADASAYLLRLATDNDDEIGLFAFNHRVQAQTACRRGKKQQLMLMDLLTQLDVGDLEADYELVRQWGQQSRKRSLFVLITSAATPASFDRIRAALLPLTRNHLPLVIAVFDRDLQQLLEEPIDDVKQAYIASAGWEATKAIAQRVSVLRKSGIECLYSDVLNVPELLGRKYQQLKLSGRL